MARAYWLAVALLSLLGAGAWLVAGRQASAQALSVSRANVAATSGTGFSYQGFLDDNGAPANGAYEFELTLYDDPLAGLQVGQPITRTQTIANGLVNLSLDFGDVFDGTALYLALGVRPVGGGAYTLLDPRQALASVPFANYAHQVQPLANVVTVAKSGGDFNTVGEALSSVSDASVSNQYLVRVGPGVYTETIDLRSYVDIEGSGQGVTTIRGIGSPSYDPASATVRASGTISTELRHLTIEADTSGAPGNYYTFGLTVQNVPYGALMVTDVAIRATGAEPAGDNHGVYNVSSSPVLRGVSIVGSGGDFSYGVFNSSSSPTLIGAVITAGGATINHGIYSINNSSPHMRDVTVRATGIVDNYGIASYGGTPFMLNLTASASGGSGINRGVHNANTSASLQHVSAYASGGSSITYAIYNDGGSPSLTDVVAAATGGSTSAYGIRNVSSSPTMRRVTASATGGGSSAYGVRNDSASPIMVDIVASASDGPLHNYGVYNASSSPMLDAVSATGSGGANQYGVYNIASSQATIRHSTLTGATASVLNAGSSDRTLVTSSMLAGPAQGGNLSCFASQNGEALPLDRSCQVGLADAALPQRAQAPAATMFSTLDSSNDAGQYPSITIGVDGFPVISYYEAIDGSNGDLKVAHCSNLQCSEATISVVDSSGNVGAHSSIAIGADGLPIISYYDAGNGDLRVAHCADVSCSSAARHRVDSAGDVGEYTSIAIGADGLPIISYFGVVVEDVGELRVAHCNDASCSSASTTTLYTLDFSFRIDTAIAVGTDGLPIIAFADGNVENRLRVAHCDNVTCTSATKGQASSASVGLSIAIGADGLAIISDVEVPLIIVHCNNVECDAPQWSLPDTNGGSDSSITIGADGLPFVAVAVAGGVRVFKCGDLVCSEAALTTVDVFSSGDVGASVAVTIGVDGLPIIAYHDATNGALRVAHCSNEFCAPFLHRR